ncbi:endonuclease 8-like 1 [Dromaius novaehollandiae]|uniref:endonuclease 8-like 1 n=1 Tax=Dromaius novaehollandiae TaxID=8790 RepID=UPI00311E005D
MPEGPELHLSGRYVNAACAGLVFAGGVERSAVSKSPAVPFSSPAYRISAAARGKEVRLTLAPLGAGEPLALAFRFGMSGSFRLCAADGVPRHAHLRFRTRERPPRALCFVDARRFGRWQLGADWQPGRGPCVLSEYPAFRENVLRNLADKAFNRPICEALLDQRYFNGIGNYLRAEILYRLKIPPFEKARTVLEALKHEKQDPSLTLSKKLKRETPDLLELCHTVPMEVVKMGKKGYDAEHSNYSTAFKNWLQCYSVPGMNSLRDSKGRTIWFQGEPGPMAPKGGKTRKKRAQLKADPEALTPEGEPGPVAPKGGKTRKKRAQLKADPEALTPEGEPGPVAPKGGKTRKKRAQLKADPEALTPEGEPGPVAPKGGKTRKKRAQLKADPEALTPEVSTRASKRRPRRAGSAPKPTEEEEEKVVADEPGQGRARRGRRRKAAAAPASSEPEAPVKAKRSRVSARRGAGAAPAV